MSGRDLVFLRVTHLRGPNIWTYRPVIEAWVDIGEFEDLPSDKLPGFTDRLLALLPGLGVHRCGVGEVGGFVERLHEGTWIGHILEHVGIELQNLAGSKLGFGKTRQIPGTTIYKVAMRTRSEVLGRAALDAGRELLLAAVNGTAYDLATTVRQLRRLADRHCLGPSTAAIVDAAIDRRIPWLSLNDGNLIQLGHGARQRRFWTAETDRTSAIAEGIASDKDMTKRLLASVGVPVPQGQVVGSVEAAWEAAQDIGLPVAIKPVDGNHGRGISLELNTRDEVEAAFPFAARHGSEVMVERFVPGNEHRLLVVGGRVAAAARGEAAWVTGDGASSIRQLVAQQLNSDPRRGTTEAHPLAPVNVDDDTAVANEIARQGWTNESVPPAGRRVLIARNGNVAFNCTNDVHPEVAATVALAARVIGLDIAGIDLVARDIGRPLAEQGGAIVEVNAGPGLTPHLRPADGPPPPVGEAIAAHLMGPHDNGRIPLVGIVGDAASCGVARLVAWLLRVSGKRTGLACSAGLFFDRRRVGTLPGTRFDAARCVLMNREVEAGVFETTARGILAEGLPYDKCSVGVVTGVTGGAALGEFHVHDDDALARVLRTQIDVVLPGGVGVLNAQDARALEMAPLCDGEIVLYAEGRNEEVARHVDGGGRAVYVLRGEIVMAQGEIAEPLELLDALRGGEGGVDGAVVIAGIATAWACGLAPDVIRAGIRTFVAELRGGGQ